MFAVTVDCQVWLDAREFSLREANRCLTFYPPQCLSSLVACRGVRVGCSLSGFCFHCVNHDA